MRKVRRVRNRSWPYNWERLCRVPALHVPCRWCILTLHWTTVDDMSDMEIRSLQSLFAVLRPPEGQSKLSGYLRAASKALGGKTDAVLARTIGVEPSSVANWKRRGSIPSDYYQWFTTTIIEKINQYNPEIRDVGFIARKSVLSLFLRTSGNPLGVESNEQDVAAMALPGLLCTAQFICEALEAHGEDVESITADRVTDLLEATAFYLKAFYQRRVSLG